MASLGLQVSYYYIIGQYWKSLMLQFRDDNRNTGYPNPYLVQHQFQSAPEVLETFDDEVIGCMLYVSGVVMHAETHTHMHR